MNLIKKLKARCGTTLIEVLLVVALIGILLGVAAPNLLQEVEALRLTAMNDSARSVAVAVQSKLYGIMNAGTKADSQYTIIKNNATVKRTMIRTEADPLTGAKEREVLFVSNFVLGDPTDADAQKRADLGRQYLLSGALTDTELLQKGMSMILIGYDEQTADVLFAFYAENAYDLDKLFIMDSDGEAVKPTETVDLNYLEDGVIGYFHGEGVPDPLRNDGLPRFALGWGWDDEFFLDMVMIGTPSPKLDGKNLGIEVYAEIPSRTVEGEYDEALIYAQGFFKDEYKTDQGISIQPDGGTLTIEDIKANKNKDGQSYMRFALDSMVMDRAYYGSAAPYLRHQNYPKVVSMADNLLYPRESIATWFNRALNPYLTYWNNELRDPSDGWSIMQRLFAGCPATEFIPVDKPMKLRVKLYVLSDETHSANEGTSSSGARLYDIDESFVPFDGTSTPASPYFYALTTDATGVTLSSIRDFNNLKYVFETENSIDHAKLSRDISSQQLYNKLVDVRYELIAENSAFTQPWSHFYNNDTVNTDSPNIRNKEHFTLSGKKPKDVGEGCYAITCTAGGGRNYNLGGFFGYAENCTFEDLDIISPRIWRNTYIRDSLKTEGDGAQSRITGITAKNDSGFSGGFVGIAVNCEFKNVRLFNDTDQTLNIEMADDVTQKDKRARQNITYYRVSGVVTGGLVGVAIGGNGNKTTFDNCAASTRVCAEFLTSVTDCIYAGGLVGLAMGNVEITNCYAACQLAGYYSGGLVGATGAGPWSYEYTEDTYKYIDNQYTKVSTTVTKKGQANEEGSDKGLTIKNSFAAGTVERTTRIGGGLIAQIGTNTPPNVTNCYSAVEWQALPPVVYGTYKGDASNYYLCPTQINVPITRTVEARFECKGDIFSLQSGVNGGKPCTVDELTTTIKLGGEWDPAATTKQWQWLNNLMVPQDSSAYPFPMPKDNTAFRGSWLKTGYNGSFSTTTPTLTFKDYHSLYYEKTDTSHAYYSDNGMVTANKTFSIADGIEDGKVVKLGGKDISVDSWAKDASDYGRSAATKVTLSSNSNGYLFEGPAFYDPGYDPIKSNVLSDFKTEEGTNFKGCDYGTWLKWDFYGFYVPYPEAVQNDDPKFKYYLEFDDNIAPGTVREESADITTGQATFGGRTFRLLCVNREEFKEKLHYISVELPESGATIGWDTQKGFYVSKTS